MDGSKDLFLRYLGQTSPYPLGLEVSRAEGCYLYDPSGKKYLDLISGFSVSNLGHCNPAIIRAITEQAGRYMHTMVYGELIQSPQVKYAQALVGCLPETLNQVFFVNSGSEAVEGALKLAKRFTGRHELVCFSNAYHGSTQGALSVMGNEMYKTAFRPLIPSIRILEFNNMDSLEAISKDTAAVIIEPIQAEAGILSASKEFFKSLADRCREVGALLLFDEIQTGFGRTGTLFAFEDTGIVPDILLLAKALGGGMPLGAFIASSDIMHSLTHHPALGHITTFGGHPVSCAAGLASLRIILERKLHLRALVMEKLVRKNLVHHSILEIRGKGLLLAAKLDSPDRVTRFFDLSLRNGLLFDYFLFCNDSIRIAPPLVITEQEILEMCRRITDTLDQTNS
ncbi:MAG: aminotransferase class III-fold pyridoxal phosphate-dependent enzyme [Bacteroidales bacterium]|jgi:acetylornithine/succinyldiaminopimelate/putrescine aminotransferase